MHMLTNILLDSADMSGLDFQLLVIQSYSRLIGTHHASACHSFRASQPSQSPWLYQPPLDPLVLADSLTRYSFTIPYLILSCHSHISRAPVTSFFPSFTFFHDITLSCHPY